MSRYCGEVDSTPVLDAAAHWRDTALLGGESVFSSKPIWTQEALDALDRHFVRNLDEGDRKFLEKLKDQLAPTKPAGKQLAAEMMWLLYLCPSSISPRHKLDVIRTVWSWSGESLPSSPWLDDSRLGGIGSAGPGFNQNQWRELTFVINLTRAFRRLSPNEQSRLLANGWDFAEWIKTVPDSRARQFRHMALFLLFPDDFERIFGQQDRKRIAQVFSKSTPSVINQQDPLELDRTLHDIRSKLVAEYGTNELDFYVPPLKQRWKSGISELAEDITAEHVRRAIDEIEQAGVPQDAESTGYDLIYGGRRYPPKLVLSMAAKNATGEDLDRGDFSGGEDSSAFRLLRKLEFEIEPKDALQTLLTKFLAQAKGESELSVRGYLSQYRGLAVKVSFGQGNFSRIPWVAFLADGQQVSKGVYPVLLFFREQNTLLLCYGVSEENKSEKSWGSVPSATTVQAWFKSRFERNPDRYGSSYVRAAYDLSKPLPVEDLNRELDLIIDAYKKIMGLKGVPGRSGAQVVRRAQELLDLPVRQDIAAVATSFSSALRDAFVSFGAGHDDLVAAFVASVVTKPLVILTGLSGSGKTQIAMRFGEWLGKDRLLMTAVRPDWTGAEALFGYEDGLKKAVDGRAAWSVPLPLQFLLKAARDPQNPYLLLLDEMNLAHVERYFADTLSGMESGKECLPNLFQGDDSHWRTKAGEADLIPFPRNLWIVGTVNVDETTYMFSPKVLDRANTFEFRVMTDALKFDSRKPQPCEVGDPALVRGLLEIARDDEWHHKNPASFAAPCGSKLKQLHALLTDYGLEFGHRVFYDALRFAALAEKVGVTGMENVLDRVVMQKVLPRLHGSRRRLEAPVLALLHFCRDLPDAVAAREQLQTLAPERFTGAPPKLPLSYDKLCRMLTNLRTNQFASFTE